MCVNLHLFALLCVNVCQFLALCVNLWQFLAVCVDAWRFSALWAERKEAAVGEWGVDHHHMSALKEQYRKGRHVKKGSEYLL